MPRFLRLFLLSLGWFLLPAADAQLPNFVPDNFVAYDRNFADIVRESVVLSRDVQRITNDAEAAAAAPGFLFRAATVDDRVLVGKIRNVCYVAFSGFADVQSQADVFRDITTDFVAFDTCGIDACCPTQSGYRDDLRDLSFLNTLLQTTRNCVTTCPGGCDLVTTGFSRGGALAQTYAIFLADLNPAILTFGQPPTSSLPCPGSIDTNRLYRFVNTRVGADGVLQYDGVPFQAINGARNSGRVFVLPPSLGTAVSYVDNAAPIIPQEFWATGEEFSGVHSAEAYALKILDIDPFVSDAVPLGIDGFRIGTPCTLSSECLDSFCQFAGSFCFQEARPTPPPAAAPTPTIVVFVPTDTFGNAGDPCGTNLDCNGGLFCDRNRCQPTGAPSRARCRANSDCASGSCERFLIFFQRCA